MEITQKELKIYSKLSRMSYYSPEKFLNKLKVSTLDKSFNQISYVCSSKNVHIYVLEGDRKNLIVFRGTSGWLSLFNNLLMWQKPLVKNSNANVHAGFYRAYNSIKDIFFELITNLPSSPTILTGHSLGGALACIAALDLVKEFPKNKDNLKIISYGAPRIGNTAFTEVFENTFTKNQLTRVVNHNDIITEMPPKILNYAHIADPTVINTKENFLNSHLKYLGISYPNFIPSRANTLSTNAKNKIIILKKTH